MRMLPATCALRGVPIRSQSQSVSAKGNYQSSSTLRRHEQTNRLHDVQVELVLAVLDAIAPPSNLTRDLGRDLGLLLTRLEETRDREVCSVTKKNDKG
jgi:hypothetical protein